ncbi:prolipoprotein diacylglyceryl transferase family protein [Sphingomonas aerophila]|uniref:Cbb3-type cytochrome oxidase subunit 3 n=1 Tax=Sphingomonas aerophila TaxID=1344948 RepID=A0A7W9BG38_9SPHN|nr:prolipoprotein diacylglyceryl transferase family protein [Sphingomonas aerophila]MBB5716538.1 cbb3-type cytochrome oxidase subunit 3 [Sphingomonas aerophila]
MLAIPTAPWAHGLFDILAWAASALTGTVLHRWRLREAAERLSRVTGPGYFAALAAGALAGAWAMGSINSLRMTTPMVSHSIAGALAGAIVAVEGYKWAAGIKGSTGTAFVGPLAIGIVFGRWGCLFAGLPDRTYGVPTALPWAVDLGDGIGRHPVEVYESLALFAFLLVFVIALAARQSWAYRRSFYVLAGWYGVQRFAWEFLKPYPMLIGPLNIFHLLCLGLVAYGCAFYAADRRRERATARRGAVPVLRRDDEPV